ncbi:MAG: HD domain-containing protein [Cytophagales bacterium]|nr:HD domain-containing protein [Cytophagales bacterium]MCA6366491.1 HD domain-containing protein [Cytophagales bacterium]MCA6372615.1 HD domain-containing protein [Cytophagales bacterium]MCA6376831.1 HD domain-containing protein [Cytophagales bacterium]MCA6383833.1 HD domain-containing protein [Cytophagales bacterium]
MNKKKIINDPVYGFISIRSELIYDIIQHPYFQRLRYIKQLGLSNLVYPGAQHTRFHHALGAMHLMGRALGTLRAKGVEVSEQELEAAQIAILLHDIGHGPLSHTLEQTLLEGVPHESLSYLFMKSLNQQFNGQLELALQFFRNSYPRKFFHQLISGQLDIDRLDYLKRDSFFTGVMEGTIGIDRIIELLNVNNGMLVVEEKGIFSIESFLHARRLMYWQVYLHKTSVSAERMLVNLIRRAQYLSHADDSLPASEPLKVFLKQNYSLAEFSTQPDLLETFGQLDDSDIWGAIKLWRDHPDEILSGLCNRLLIRELFQISLRVDPITKTEIEKVRQAVHQSFGILRKDANYLFSYGTVSNEAYITGGQPINILTKSGQVIDIVEASDLPTIRAMSKIVEKNYLCWPKNIYL